MSDLPNLDGAREALAAYDAWLHGRGNCRFDTLPAHLRTALAAVDILTCDLACCHLLVLTEEEEEAKDGADVAALASEAYDAVKAWAEDMDMQLVSALARVADVEKERDEAIARLAEAEATLANERGEAAPSGWTSRTRGDSVRWVRDGSQRPGRMCDAVYGKNPDGTFGWHWWDRDVDLDGEVGDTYGSGYARTAREAMKAADAPKATP